MIKLKNYTPVESTTVYNMKPGQIGRVLPSKLVKTDKWDLSGSIVVCIFNNTHLKNEVYTLVSSIKDDNRYTGPWAKDTPIEILNGELTLELLG